MKLKTKLHQLQRRAPHFSEHGQMYKSKKQTARTYSKVTLYCLFRSQENTLTIKEHVFVKKYKTISPEEWSAFFARDLSKIHREMILPGLAIRTGKTWGVDRIIGWIGDAKHKPINPESDSPRAKANHKRKSRG
jgi:hypothetical protein